VFTKRLAATKHCEAIGSINVSNIPSEFFPSK
jgi:hypothetical protein